MLFLQIASPVASIASVTTINAYTMTLARPSSVTIKMQSDEAGMINSLREDVSRHPDDFVTFETQTAAFRFIEGHGFEANRETARLMIKRGVLGYWRGKMVVVVPISWDLAAPIVKHSAH